MLVCCQLCITQVRIWFLRCYDVRKPRWQVIKFTRRNIVWSVDANFLSLATLTMLPQSFTVFDWQVMSSIKQEMFNNADKGEACIKATLRHLWCLCTTPHEPGNSCKMSSRKYWVSIQYRIRSYYSVNPYLSIKDNCSYCSKAYSSNHWAKCAFSKIRLRLLFTEQHIIIFLGVTVNNISAHYYLHVFYNLKTLHGNFPFSYKHCSHTFTVTLSLDLYLWKLGINHFFETFS